MRRPGRWQILLLAFLLIPFPSLLAGDGVEVEETIDRLEAIDTVGGRSVGYGGAPSPFWKLYRHLSAAGVDGLPERLMKSPKPVARAMGLALLVERDGADAVPVLRQRLSDRGPFWLQPYGCIVTDGSVLDKAPRPLPMSRHR
jgi:hypothetical protein